MKALTLLLCLLALAPASRVFAQPQLATIGWVEDVWFDMLGGSLPAKIDTGADNSSVHAEDWTITGEGRERTVSFTLVKRDGSQVSLTSPLLKITRIKSRTDGRIERPVIMLDVCIAGQAIQARFNLSKRAKFKYPVLVGRSLLAGHFLVDSGRTDTSKPGCSGATRPRNGR